MRLSLSGAVRVTSTTLRRNASHSYKDHCTECWAWGVTLATTEVRFAAFRVAAGNFARRRSAHVPHLTLHLTRCDTPVNTHHQTHTRDDAHTHKTNTRQHTHTHTHLPLKHPVSLPLLVQKGALRVVRWRAKARVVHELIPVHISKAVWFGQVRTGLARSTFAELGGLSTWFDYLAQGLVRVDFRFAET